MNPTFLAELRRVLGDDGVRQSDAEKHAYSSDAYTLLKARPGVVALPRTTEEVAGVVRLCARRTVCGSGASRITSSAKVVVNNSLAMFRIGVSISGSGRSEGFGRSDAGWPHPAGRPRPEGCTLR